MTIYTARLDLALALRSRTPEPGEPAPTPGDADGHGGPPGATGDPGGAAVAPTTVDDSS
jgi:hypothetical protein